MVLVRHLSSHHSAILDGHHASYSSSSSLRHHHSSNHHLHRSSTRRFQNYNSSSKRGGCNHNDSSMMLLEDDDGNMEIIRLLQRQADALQEELRREQQVGRVEPAAADAPQAAAACLSPPQSQLPKFMSPHDSSNWMVAFPSEARDEDGNQMAQLRQQLHGSVRSLKASLQERRRGRNRRMGASDSCLPTMDSATAAATDHDWKVVQQLETSIRTSTTIMDQENDLQFKQAQLERQNRQQAKRIAELEAQLRDLQQQQPSNKA